MTNSSPNIRYLTRNQLNTKKWDDCVYQSANGLIYALSFYLDSMAKNWSALILNDYEIIMPLTWNRKFGFSYLYQPVFTAQLGIFSTRPVEPGEISLFVHELKMRFRFCEIHFNHAYNIEKGIERANYILDLNKFYPELKKNYKKRLLENLKEADSFQPAYVSSSNFPETINLFKREYGRRLRQIKKTDYENFESLCRVLSSKGMIFQRGIIDPSGELLSCSIFLKDNRRIYNIMSVTMPDGRKKRSHFYLVDNLIHEFSGQHLLLDFEGSNVPGIAEFYRKFGSVNQPYWYFRYNHLPYPFNLFKRS
jgi:hypothetical protein